MKSKHKGKKVGIFIIAYRAVETLISAYQRIPSSVKRKAQEIYCIDDCSNDNTYYAALGYKIANKIKNFTLYKNPKNLGYGGNQKKGYRYAIKKKLDVVVMLHGDAQYAPEKMPLLLDVFDHTEDEKIGMVMGSRMLEDPLKGGMPVYKYLGNKVLTFLENIILCTKLSEFHSGYRAYNVNALRNLPFEKCSNDFQFDTEIIIMLKQAGYKIIEVPIPTYYGPGSKSHVNVLKYGMQCLVSVIDYRLTQLGLKKNSKFDFPYKVGVEYQYKSQEGSSHNKIAKLIKERKNLDILDIGCAGGFISRAVGDKSGYNFVGVESDLTWKDDIGLEKYQKIIWTSVETKNWLNDIHDRKFDVIVCADVLEHLHHPENILKQLKTLLKDDGRLLVSLPNMDYLPVYIIRRIFPKFRMSKGPLDRTHIGIYNLDISKQLIEKEFTINNMDFTSAPITSMMNKKHWFTKKITKFNIFLSKLYPKLFAYQFIISALPR